MQPPSDHHLLQMARAREAAAAQRQHALVAEVRHYRSVIRRNKPIALDPTSKWLRVWDACFLGPAMLWSASVTPFEIGFLPFAFNSLWHANRIIDLILFLDLCLQFIIGYREHPSQGGRLITSIPRIATRYATSWLLVDLTSALPFELFVRLSAAAALSSDATTALTGEHATLNATVARFARLGGMLRLLKLLRLVRVARLIARGEGSIARLPYAVMRALTMLCLTILIIHWIACVWGFYGRAMALEDLWSAAAEEEVAQQQLADNANATVRFRFGWMSRAGVGTPNVGVDAPVLHLYSIALHTAVVTVLGGPCDLGSSGELTASERVVRVLMMVLGGLLWGYALCSIVALGPSLWPHLITDAQVEEEVNEMCHERQLPSTLKSRLTSYLKETAPLQRTAKYELLLERMSARLRGDTAHAIVNATFKIHVPYLQSNPQQSAYYGVRHPPIERDFIANVSLALQQSLHAPRDPIPAETLTLIERGVAARRGRLLTPGETIGEDFVVALNVFRDRSPAVALSYCQVGCLRRDALQSLLASGAYPNAVLAVRRAAVSYALRRAVVLIAQRVRDVQSTKPPGAEMEVEGDEELICAKPMRLLLEEENANAMAAAANEAAAGGGGGGAASVAEGGGGGDEGMMLMRAVEASGARMEAAVEAMRTQMTTPQAQANISVMPSTVRSAGGGGCGGGQASQRTTLPLGWVMYYDNGKPYYHDTTSGTVQWEPPPGIRLHAECLSMRNETTSEPMTPAHHLQRPPSQHSTTLTHSKRAKRNVCQGQHAPSAPTLSIAPGEGMPADHLMQQAMERAHQQAMAALEA